MTKSKLRPRVAGKFQLIATKPDGSIRVLADWFDNLILDAGLNRIGTGGVMTWCQVGAGSTAPAPTDTGLQSLVASKSGAFTSSNGSQATEPYFGWVRQTYRFEAGLATGNLSEVGIGWDSPNSLFSRALIKDAEGAPTTITVLADETLDVAYEIRIYPPLADVAFGAVIGGVTHACVMRAAGVTGSGWVPDFLPAYGATLSASVAPFEGPLGTIVQNPSGSGAAGADIVYGAYANNSLVAAIAATFGLEQGNIVGGIGAVLIQTLFVGSYQISFDPKIAKDNTKTLSLDIELSWDRYTA